MNCSQQRQKDLFTDIKKVLQIENYHFDNSKNINKEKIEKKTVFNTILILLQTNQLKLRIGETKLTLRFFYFSTLQVMILFIFIYFF